MITHESFHKLLGEVLQEQGYFVIGCTSDSPRYFNLGERTNKLMQFQVSTPFEIYATTTRAAWVKQNDLIQRLRPNWHRFPDSIGGAFFLVRPDTEGAA